MGELFAFTGARIDLGHIPGLVGGALRKPAPTAGLFHITRYFRSLRGHQILVRGQLLHLAAFRKTSVGFLRLE